MELNFNSSRVAVLVILIAAFALLGGFSIPEGMPSRMMRTWSLSVLLFAISAISATVVDHWIGNLDRSNLRWFYIVVGVAGMAGAMLMQHIVHEQVLPIEAAILGQ
ncbi:hypothetical protein [Haloferula sp.]|uniref:hypothetical protein n=1 Tax=Haloferula sp. TaxID=2497595 RepID=UPI00329CCD57